MAVNEQTIYVIHEVHGEGYLHPQVTIEISLCFGQLINELYDKRGTRKTIFTAMYIQENTILCILFVFDRSDYAQLVDEAWYINAQGACLAALAILMSFLLFSNTFSRRTSPVAFVQPPSSNNHYVMTQKSYYYREHDP